MKRTIDIIAGGAGFVGSHLVSECLKQGHYVIVIDNFYTGRIQNLREVIESIHGSKLQIKNMNIARMDITEAIELRELAYKYGDELRIFNLACPASPPAYQQMPIQTLDTCYTGTKQMLDLAKTLHAKVFVHTSTSEVYGDPLVHPQTEDYRGNVSCTGIRACYDEGKRVAETLICEYQRQYGLNTKIARLFNTYGPHMDPLDGRVVSNFIIQALQSKPITIYGDGSQTRSFCYVSDTVRGLLALADSDDAFHGPVNIGNDHEFTILQLTETLTNLLPFKPDIQYCGLPADDPTRRKPDLTLARQYLDYEPTVQLHEGLQYTIEYFKQELAHGNVLKAKWEK